MSEMQKLFTALSSDATKKHEDLKFFLGDNRNVTVDDIARECRIAIEEDAKGLLQPNAALDKTL